MFNLTFKGAACTTTGSMHIVEVNGLRLLLDCGLFQGSRKEAFERNRSLDVNPATIDAVLVSHAHIDHSGNLPTLARRGFRGKVFSTLATRDLCDIMLRDSAFIQQHDLEFVNKKRAAQGKNLFEPLYLEEDVSKIMSKFEPEPYKRLFDLGRNVYACFHNAGHILGSAIVEIVAKQPDGKFRRLLFSGDLGQPDQPILKDYDIVEGTDVLIVESTYADRNHPPKTDVKARIKSFVDDICQQHSKLIIPAFSVGRTQQILYYLHELQRDGRIPQIPIYVDSPLSLKATRIYEKHQDCYDEEASAIIRQGYDLFRLPGLKFVETADDSRKLNDIPGPMIIIAASGMCEGGRILHHLKNNIENPRNIVLIVGYQAENTLGRRIVELKNPLKILGDTFELNARVHTINALSAHADKTALEHWVKAINKNKTIKTAFAVHGEIDKVEAMKKLLENAGYANVAVPKPGEMFRNL